MTEEIKYSVNLELGDEASEMLYRAAQATWKGQSGVRDIVAQQGFSGKRFMRVDGLPKGTVMNLGCDGVGTKMELAERIGKHDTIAHDLFAMVCDDAVRDGAEPIAVATILDVNSLENESGEIFKDQMMQLCRGYVDAAKAANVVIVNGEIAELGSRVGGFGPFNYNWGATVYWLANEKRILDGSKIKPGMPIWAFGEKGFRSNGLSLVRKIGETVYGAEWHKHDFSGSEGQTLGEAVLRPSQIYTKAIVEMTGGWDLEVEPKVDVAGIAHITGGGLPGKLGRLLGPLGLGAEIKSPMPCCLAMQELKSLGNVKNFNAYKTWNMGHGMVIISDDGEEIQKIAKSYDIESSLIGEVVESDTIRIQHSVDEPLEYKI